MKKIFSVVFFYLAAVILTSCGESKDNDVEKVESELKVISEKINNDFVKLKAPIYEISDYVQKLYLPENVEKNLKNVDKSQYALSKSNVFYRIDYSVKPAVFVSGYVPVDEKIKRIVYFTEPVDSLLMSVVKNNPEIVQVYYNDKYSYNRIYPGFDVLSQYEPAMNIPAYNFYYLADGKHNPEKKAVWVNEPYVDPAGRGWMVSLIAPCYFNNELVGVPGIDITINLITDRYLKNSSRSIMIISSDGTVVSTDENLANLFSLPPLKNHRYIETIKSDTYLQSDYNLKQSKDNNVRKALESILKGEKEITYIKNQKEYYLLYEKIDELNWYALTLAAK